ncbi:hypothetical protein EJC49_22510 [Aquibium carbonis]|uniref:Uncharacterized protein n=1 Tax=Aquibium carbonis TaxID=2495581 RepID=A0A429YPT9_9HYPH|nr:hypothetical protein [Aquibium carbonis]RST83465.1 hypothetical protein EJC49_22510 [Aquibium carbonis]
MFDFWTNISEGQGAVVSSIFTIIAAALGVVLGSRLFGGKVTDLRKALRHAEEALNTHERSVDHKLREILDNIKFVEVNVVSSLEKISRVSGEIVTSNLADENANPEQQQSNIERIRSDWRKLSESLEDIVSDVSIDGRTRAKYARIDRRQYGQLIESYHEDFGLPNVTKYRRALQIWHKYRNGRSVPTDIEVQEMSRLSAELAPD